MTSPGRLIAVVGPSGVGKDSLMAALADADPRLSLVRRVITRDADKGGEPFEAVSEARFADLVAAGAFCLHWQAHGLSYGIPATTLDDVEAGALKLVNLSRTVLREANALAPGFLVLNVIARPETLAARLRGRGRETEADIARRLARATQALPDDLPVLTLSNDGPLQETVAAALSAVLSQTARLQETSQ